MSSLSAGPNACSNVDLAAAKRSFRLSDRRNPLDSKQGCWSQHQQPGVEASVFRFLHSGSVRFGWTPVRSDGCRGGIR